jgi:hypothetical protein
VHKDEFNAELDAAFVARDLAEEPGDVQMIDDQFPPAPRTAINRHREVKRAAQVTASLGGIALSGAQYATGTGAIALATGAAGAVSATGIGLVVAGAAVTVASVGLAATSAVKTHRHLLALEDLYHGRAQYASRCHEVAFMAHGAKRGIQEQTVWSQRTHNFIADHLLPFIINKKGSKFSRKCVACVPIAGGILVNGYAISRKIYKVVTRTAGVQRFTAAYWLAEHFCRCSCPFVDNIVSALYSVDEMNWLHERCDYHEIAGFLADKMKST